MLIYLYSFIKVLRKVIVKQKPNSKKFGSTSTFKKVEQNKFGSTIPLRKV